MKENKRTIPVVLLLFCKGCENETLFLHTKRLYADNEEYLCYPLNILCEITVQIVRKMCYTSNTAKNSF